MSKKKQANKSHPTSPGVPTTIREGIKKLSRYPWLCATALTAGILLSIYAPALDAPTFIFHEDSVLRLPLLSQPANIPNIFSRDFLLFTEGQFRPFSYAMLSVIQPSVSPENVLFWHGLLLFFHALNMLLVFGLARHFTPRLSAALCAASAFGLHPLATTLVNDINQFYMILGLTLALGSIKAYLTFSHNGSTYRYFLSFAAYSVGLITARLAFSVGLILLVYELAYARSGYKRIILRLAPYVVIPLILSPWLCMTTPHPLHFKYVQTHGGSLFHGFFSVIGATGIFADGLLLTMKLPVLLHETVQNIFSGSHPKFLFWLAFNLVIITGAVWAAIRRQWIAVGLLIIYLSTVPYASVAYNRVVDYVSWTYLYFPLAGLALFVGGLYEILTGLQRRSIRIGVRVLVVTVLLFWGARTIQLNRYAQTPLTYWKHLSMLNSSSQTVSHEIGKSYLAQDMPSHALHYFFAPMVKDIKPSCLAMAKYYFRQGNFLASAIHLRFGSGKKTTGVVLEDHCEVAAALLVAAGAPDHAEENLGKILMVNPFDTAAMSYLAQVWYLKGFVCEGGRMLECVRIISPNDENANRTQAQFDRLDRTREEGKKVVIDPPPPDWLDYVLTQKRSPEMRRKIIAFSDQADPNDAIIQLEATISLLENAEYERAAQRALSVSKCLRKYPFACSVTCEAIARGGNIEQAIQIGHQAVALDTKSEMAWKSLAIAYALKGELDERAQGFIKTIEHNPGLASMFYYNLGMQKSKKKLDLEAIECFQKAVEANPANADAQRALGESLLLTERPELAVESLRASLKIKPDNPETHVRLGRALMAQKKDKEGIESFRTAIMIDPKNASYHYFLGSALANGGNQDEIVREYHRAIELNPKFTDAYFNLGNTYFKTEQYDDAVKHYQKLIQLDPAYQYAHMNLGTIYQRWKQYDEAIDEYQQEIQIQPKFTEPYNRIILILTRQGKLDPARDIADRAKQLGHQLAPKALQAIQ